jgi:glycosyltransferase involved in cell wall biosynthesis
MSRHARWPWLRQRFLEFNARRIAALEQSLLESADLVTAITEEDRIAFVHRAPGRSFVTLSPGYSGPLAAPRRITRDTPRRVLLMGSFDWVVKRENLKQFLAVADPVFAREAITLDVLGDVPADLRDELTACRAVRFHGFVKDPADLLDNARIGVVPELIGGGFKLKLLDYFFGRLPVATIAGAAAGLSMPLREHILQGSDMQTLVAAIVAGIDDLDRLNAMQERGATLAQSEFQWRDRGRVFHAALERLVRSGSTVPLARIPEALDSLDMAGD